MAIYHLSVKIISRSSGRSSVAAAAYRSGDILTNEWDGITHDYSKKHWIEHTEILLPSNAPKEFKDRSTLWNAVETAEKSSNAQLAREVEIALPIELSPQERLRLLRDYVLENFVSKGMCADFAVHNPPLTDAKGRPIDINGTPINDISQMIFQNPHAHILLTMRPLDREGNWEPKSRTVYLCKRGREEQAFSAGEIKPAVSQGWMKQYQYKIGRKKVWLTKESGERKGLKRVNKQPKTRKEMNPLLQEWNAKDSIFLWRERWACACNEVLKQNGINERIDHRSYEVQGVDRLPQTHLGPQIWQMEKKGIRTSKGELNRRIRENNRFLKTFEEQIQEMERKEKEHVEKTAARLEGLRARSIAYAYERISISRIIKAIENEEQDDIARAAVLAKALEQILNAIDSLTKTVEQSKQELRFLKPLDHERRESLKETILANEKQIASLKERRRTLYGSYKPLPKGKRTDPDVIKKYKERLTFIKEEQKKINLEFTQLVNANKDYMKQLKALSLTRREPYTEQTKGRLKEHYKNKFDSDLWRTSMEQAPDFPVAEVIPFKHDHIHRR